MVQNQTTVGQYLREKRGEKNISLETVAGITKIPLTSLQAMEEDEFRRLPGEAYVRGFLRSYARCLCLENPNEMLTLYTHQRASTIFNDEEKSTVPRPFLRNILNPISHLMLTLLGAETSPPFGKATLRARD